jgi:hypothetical protein
MEGTIKKTTTGYIVYGYTDLSHRFGYHGIGDKGFPQDALTACIPFLRPKCGKVLYQKTHERRCGDYRSAIRHYIHIQDTQITIAA